MNWFASLKRTRLLRSSFHSLFQCWIKEPVHWETEKVCLFNKWMKRYQIQRLFFVSISSTLFHSTFKDFITIKKNWIFGKYVEDVFYLLLVLSWFIWGQKHLFKTDKNSNKPQRHLNLTCTVMVHMASKISVIICILIFDSPCFVPSLLTWPVPIIRLTFPSLSDFCILLACLKFFPSFSEFPHEYVPMTIACRAWRIICNADIKLRLASFKTKTSYPLSLCLKTLLLCFCSDRNQARASHSSIINHIPIPHLSFV